MSSLAGAASEQASPAEQASSSAADAGRAIAEYETRTRWARRRRHIAVVSCRVAILAAILGTWQLYGSSSSYRSFVIGTPARTWTVIRQWSVQRDFWAVDVWQTVREAGLGYLIGIAIAIALVVVVALIPGGYAFLGSFLAALNALPKIVLAPLFILWFGLTTSGKVAFVATSIFFVVFYGVHSGIRSIDPSLIENARMLGGSSLQLTPTLYIPAVMTWLLVSLRISATFSLLAAVVSQYLGSEAGLGHLIAAGRSALKVDVVLAGVVYLGALSLCFDRVLLRVQRRFEKRRVF